MWHDAKEIVSEPKIVSRCFLLYYLDHGHNSIVVWFDGIIIV